MSTQIQVEPDNEMAAPAASTPQQIDDFWTLLDPTHAPRAINSPGGPTARTPSAPASILPDEYPRDILFCPALAEELTSCGREYFDPLLAHHPIRQPRFLDNIRIYGDADISIGERNEAKVTATMDHLCDMLLELTTSFDQVPGVRVGDSGARALYHVTWLIAIMASTPGSASSPNFVCAFTPWTAIWSAHDLGAAAFHAFSWQPCYGPYVVCCLSPLCFWQHGVPVLHLPQVRHKPDKKPVKRT